MKRLAVFLVILLSGCASLGLPTAKTFNEKLAAAYGGITVVLQTDATLLQAGTITKVDAQNIETQADNVKAALDISREIYATDQTTGGNKLASAITALGALNTYLATKGPTK